MGREERVSLSPVSSACQSLAEGSGVGLDTVVDPLPSWKSTYNFWLPRNLTNSLLLTGSLINNKQWINTYFVCYMYYILYSYNKIRERENVIKKIIGREIQY